MLLWGLWYNTVTERTYGMQVKALGLVLGLLGVSTVCAEVVPLWGEGAVPGRVTTNTETLRAEHVYDVSVPMLEFFRAEQPSGKALPTVLVIPGGGYQCQAYIKEGTEVAQWLNTLGYHAAVVKYRIPGDREGALQDVLQAVQLLRERAEAWQVDVRRIGMIGFSAGAHLTSRVLAQPEHGLAYALFIYPAYLSGDGVNLAPEVVPTSPTVPTFIAQCGDDRAYVFSSIAYAGWLLKQNRPVTYHLYTRGGHGFGLRKAPPEEAAQLKPAIAQWLKALR